MKKKSKGRIQRFEEQTQKTEERRQAEVRPTAAKKPAKKVRINRSRMTLTIIVVVLVLALLMSVKGIFTLRAEQKNLKAQNEALLLEKESLKDELENVSDKEYIEEQARIQLKLIKPGEILYILDDEKDKEENKDDYEKEKDNEKEN